MDPPGCVMSLAAAGDKSALSSVDMTGTSLPRPRRELACWSPHPGPWAQLKAEGIWRQFSLCCSIKVWGSRSGLRVAQWWEKRGRKKGRRRLDRDTQGERVKLEGERETEPPYPGEGYRPRVLGYSSRAVLTARPLGGMSCHPCSKPQCPCPLWCTEVVVPRISSPGLDREHASLSQQRLKPGDLSSFSASLRISVIFKGPWGLARGHKTAELSTYLNLQLQSVTALQVAPLGAARIGDRASHPWSCRLSEQKPWFCAGKDWTLFPTCWNCFDSVFKSHN